MASLSSCDHNKSYQYDVFLSFSGEDTRKTFVDHLYAALDRQSICTFKDDERLEKGRNISDDLLQSIEESRFYIIVFSKRYASSSWCLNELLKIMECHKTNEHTAFPVFYDVDPSEVRKQNGLVGEALAMHKNKNESEVEKWREALTEASNLSGWDVRKTANGHEAKVTKLIVERVSLELRPINLNVDESLIGMEQRMQDFDSCLDIESNDVRMIGIKGMGGAGKTTLARAIFDKISINFEGTSFVENVRERASQSSLKKLQKQILKDVCKDDGITIRGVLEGKKLMKKKLCGKKVLVVLDDVDHINQLEMLAGDLAWFKSGSRIIITTRDEQVLDAHRVKWIRDVSLLSQEEAICLFSMHAFGKSIPTEAYERHSHEVVRYANGLPLTIKVLGSNLCGKDDSEWTDVLQRLKTIPLKETLRVLELSYENLEDDHKEIFLDVACFLRGWNKDDAIIMLESCGFYAKNGLRVLKKKSLLSYGATIDIHDSLVEMGKNIVRREHPRESNMHSRLWVQEEIEHVLANDSVTEATRCINLRITPEIVLKSLRNMKKLRCLIVNRHVYNLSNDCAVIDEAHQYFPNSLQYVFWKYYPHWCLPKTFEANNIVTLEMPRSNIEQLWEGRKVMKKLKFLFLQSSKLKRLDLGLTPNLKRLHVKSCRDLVKLYVHGGCLKSLVYLNLSGCLSLKSFLFIEQLESLEVLHMDELTLREFPEYITTGHSNNSLLEFHLAYNYIEEIPSSIGNLHKLVSLDLSYCSILNSLPESIFCLQHLRSLNLGFTTIEELPDDVGQLKYLETLNLSGTQIKHLTGSICMLKHLKTLLLHSCIFLKKLPEDIGQLEFLKKLDLRFCSDLRAIPSNICKLKHLKELQLEGCRRLAKFPVDMGDIECLKFLNIEDTGITHLPSSISLLKGLKIYRSEVKDQIPDDFIQLCFKYDFEKRQIQGFERLEEINLSNAYVKHLPDSIHMLKHLKKLVLQRCVLLEKLPDNIGQLESLEELDLSRCYSIRVIPSSICMLKQLKILNLHHCFCLEKLPEDIGQLASLEELYITRCYNITEIPSSIRMLKHLTILELEGCRRLEKLSDELEDYIFGILE